MELLRYLMGRFEHVSYERVLSGPGLHNIYDFLRDTGRGEEPAWLADAIAHGDPSAAIAKSGLEGTSDLGVQALDIFVSIYGAEAGQPGVEGGGYRWNVHRRRNRAEDHSKADRAGVPERVSGQRPHQPVAERHPGARYHERQNGAAWRGPRGSWPLSAKRNAGDLSGSLGLEVQANAELQFAWQVGL